MVTEKIMVKGVMFNAARDAVLDMFGEQGLEAVKAAMNSEDRSQLFDRQIMMISKVDMNAVIRFLATADRQLGKGNGSTMEALCHKLCNKLLTGIYKIFLKLASPEFLINNGVKMFKQVFDRGWLEVKWHGPKHVSEFIHDFPAEPEHEKTILAIQTEALMLSGAKNLRAEHSACILRGDAFCEYEYHWD